MATVTTSQNSRQFKDLDLSFNIHPVRKDINKHLDDQAIVNAIKNILLTNHYEKPFDPDFGSNVRKFLFENMDTITAINLEREIEEVINNYEPRVNVTKVIASPDFENNGYSIKMEFTVINLTNPVVIQFFLQRAR